MITAKRLARLAALPLALSLLAAACGGDDAGGGGDTATTAGTGSAGTTTAGGNLASATLDGSGATFPQAFYEEAMAVFMEDNGEVTLTYGGGGSGKGREDLQNQIVDWAGSDSPVKAEDLPKYKGGEILLFPTVLAPITVSYNLPGVEELDLSPDTIAGIFQTTIKTWDDPAIAADNPDADLPGTDITVVHRADSSGTTDNFTKFLDAAAGADGSGEWTLGSGSTVEWPANTQAGDGNSGVANAVKSAEGAIGYVDLSDAVASDLTFANIENAAGNFVAPTLEAASAAADGVEIADDLTFFAGWAEGDDVYPIAAQTWILVYKQQPDAAKGAAMKAFLNFILTDGQELAPDVDYAPLPESLRDRALAQLDQIVLP